MIANIALVEVNSAENNVDGSSEPMEEITDRHGSSVGLEARNDIAHATQANKDANGHGKDGNGEGAAQNGEAENQQGDGGLHRDVNIVVLDNEDEDGYEPEGSAQKEGNSGTLVQLEALNHGRKADQLARESERGLEVSHTSHAEHVQRVEMPEEVDARGGHHEYTWGA